LLRRCCSIGSKINFGLTVRRPELSELPGLCAAKAQTFSMQSLFVMVVAVVRFPRVAAGSLYSVEGLRFTKGTAFLEVADGGGGDPDACHQQPQNDQVADVLDLIGHWGEAIDFRREDRDAG
jgi:hypothetical protein